MSRDRIEELRVGTNSENSNEKNIKPRTKNIHDNRSETNKGDSGTKNDANFSRNNDSMTDYFNHRFMRMQQKLTDVVFDNIEKYIDCMISGEITISNQNSNKEGQTQGS